MKYKNNYDNNNNNNYSMKWRWLVVDINRAASGEVNIQL